MSHRLHEIGLRLFSILLQGRSRREQATLCEGLSTESLGEIRGQLRHPLTIEPADRSRVRRIFVRLHDAGVSAESSLWRAGVYFSVWSLAERHGAVISDWTKGADRPLAEAARDDYHAWIMSRQWTLGPGLFDLVESLLWTHDDLSV